MPTSLISVGIHLAATAAVTAAASSLSSLILPEKGLFDAQLHASRRAISDKPFQPQEALANRTLSMTLRPPYSSSAAHGAGSLKSFLFLAFTKSVLFPLVGAFYLMHWARSRERKDTLSIQMSVATKFWLNDVSTRIAIHHYIRTGHQQDQATREKMLAALYLNPCDRVCDLTEIILENNIKSKRITEACRLILQTAIGSIEDVAGAKKAIKFLIMRNHPDKNMQMQWSKPCYLKDAAVILRLLLLAKRILETDAVIKNIVPDGKRTESLFA